MTLEVANIDNSPKTMLAQADQLRKRLRTIKRFRRQSLTSGAMKLESLLADILLGLSSETAKIPSKVASTGEPKSEGISRDEHQRLLTLLDHSRREYDSLIDFIDAERTSRKPVAEAEVHSKPYLLKEDSVDFECPIPRPLSNDVSILHNQIEFLEQELSHALKVTGDNKAEEASLREQIEVLRTQLLESRHETIELRIQNSDLSDQTDRSTSNMTWEQRKEQLMQQLEAENSTDEQTRADNDRVAEIIAVTQREIDQRDRTIRERDREIDELQMILTRQSSITNGVAVGAAAVAQLLDSDEFIREERERVRIMQRELEEKLRNAEIEISLERARFSRERLEFESTIVSRQLESAAVEASKDCERSEQEPLGKPRRWLRRLGLRED